MTDDPLQRLGALVRRRRIVLNLSQRDAAARARISDQTWLNIENGRGATERKLAQVERALDWPSGTIDSVMAGEDEPASLVGLSSRDRLLALLAAEDLSSDEIEQVIRFVREMRTRKAPAG